MLKITAAPKWQLTSSRGPLSSKSSKRVYLFGYEEFTGYTAFDVISPTPPNARKISSFVKAVEEHLGLPVRRFCLIGKEFESWQKPSHSNRSTSDT